MAIHKTFPDWKVNGVQSHVARSQNLSCSKRSLLDARCVNPASNTQQPQVPSHFLPAIQEAAKLERILRNCADRVRIRSRFFSSRFLQRQKDFRKAPITASVPRGFYCSGLQRGNSRVHSWSQLRRESSPSQPDSRDEVTCAWTSGS